MNLIYKDMAEKNCRLITFYTLIGKNWHMKCHRSYLQSLKMGFRHIFKGHAFAFSVKKHIHNVYMLKILYKTGNNFPVNV